MNDRAKQIAAKIVADVWPYTWLSAGVMRDLEAAVEKHMIRPHQVRDHVGIIWEQMSDGCYRTLNGAKTDYIDRNFGPLTEVHGEPPPDAGEVAKLKERIAEKEKLSIKMEIEHDEIMQAAIKESDRQRKRIDELAGLCGKQKERIAELENDLKAAVAFDALRCATVDARDRQIAELEKLSAKLEKSRNEISSKFSRAEVHIAELEKQLAAAVKAEPAKPQPEAIWQKVSEREWVFGVPVRGIIWQPIAKVVDGCDWFWHLTDLSQKGHNQHFRDAIEAATAVAEKAMGVK